MSQINSLDLSISPQAFFHERVSSASHNLNIKLDADVEFYVVNLLIEFINPAKVNEEFDTDVLGTPLVMLLKQTIEAPELKRPSMYRRLGDTSLYISGFFQDYFNDKAFDINYFITMGASAYYQAASLSRSLGKDHQKPDTLEQISDKFVQLVDIVAQASDGSRTAKDTDLLSLYDRWNRTGSDRLKSILLENGITPVSTPFKIAQ